MFHMSSVLKQMLDASDVEPCTLEMAIAARIRRRMPHMCEVDHFPRMLARTTGAVVTKLWRKNRYVLLQLNSRGLYYRESNATECSAIAPGELPHTAMTAALGRRLQEVVELGPLDAALGPCRIAAAGPAWEGATRFALEPRWLRVER